MLVYNGFDFKLCVCLCTFLCSFLVSPFLIFLLVFVFVMSFFFLFHLPVCLRERKDREFEKSGGEYNLGWEEGEEIDQNILYDNNFIFNKNKIIL